MRIIENGYRRELMPDVGKLLYKDEQDTRIFSQHVYLGVSASSDDWHECTNAEKEEWESKHKEEEND